MSSKFKSQQNKTEKTELNHEKVEGALGHLPAVPSKEEHWDPVTKMNAKVMREVLEMKWKSLKGSSVNPKFDRK